MPSRHRSLAMLVALLAGCWGTPGPSRAGGLLAAAPVNLPRALGDLSGSLHDVDLDVRRLADARSLHLARFLRANRELLDRDANGAPMLRSEVVAIDPTPAALERARADGFTSLGERLFPELDLRIVVLRSPSGMGTRAALRRLRGLDPSGSYDFNHLYFASASSTAPAAFSAMPPEATTRRAPLGGPMRAGLIDGGVARQHAALAGVQVKSWGCEGKLFPDAHGTAVASLLMGGDGGLPPAPGSVLYSADIYCGRPAGGAVTGFVEAMAWMAQQKVPVINISLVGPNNKLLERATQSMLGHGYVLVAAVGNDGPAAPPLYPASFPGVIGVTAVDRRNRVLPEAGRGAQVDFAAIGNQLRVAAPGGEWTTARGTSFAAPLVARAAARVADAPGKGVLDRVYAELARQALDLGKAGRDDSYGQGLLRMEENGPSIRKP